MRLSNCGIGLEYTELLEILCDGKYILFPLYSYYYFIKLSVQDMDTLLTKSMAMLLCYKRSHGVQRVGNAKMIIFIHCYSWWNYIPRGPTT